MPVAADGVVAVAAVRVGVPAAKARGLVVRLDEDEVPGEWLPLARSAALDPAIAARAAAAERMTTGRRHDLGLAGTVRPSGCGMSADLA
jgi:hypothetical protein